MNNAIIVTGASSGIGNLISSRLKCWRYTTIFGIDIKKPEHSHHNIIIENVNNEQGIGKIIKKISKDFNIIGLVNCAGISLPDTYNLKNWNKTLDINLSGAMICSKIAAEYMKKNKYGKIVNIASINSLLGFSDNPAYVTSKTALIGLTRAMAMDYGKYGIRINAISPGYIITGMTLKSYNDTRRRKDVEKRTILNKWGTPGEVFDLCEFLLSEKSDYITGQNIIIDGGLSIKGI